MPNDFSIVDPPPAPAILNPQDPAPAPLAGPQSIPLSAMTPEQQQEIQRQLNSPPGVDPVDTFSPEQLAELSIKSKGQFDPIQYAVANPNRLNDPNIEAKLTDTHALLAQRGFKVEDIDLGQSAKDLWSIVPGMAKWAGRALSLGSNYNLVRNLFPPSDAKERQKFENEQAKKSAELVSSTELAVTGLGELAKKAATKAGRATGILTAPADQPYEDRKNDFWGAVGMALQKKSITEGHGEAVNAALGGVVKDFEAQGVKVDPEVVAKLSAGDPLTFVAIPGGFKIVGAGAKTIARVASRATAVELVTALRSAQRAAVTATGAEAKASTALNLANREVGAAQAATAAGGDASQLLQREATATAVSQEAAQKAVDAYAKLQEAHAGVAAAESAVANSTTASAVQKVGALADKAKAVVVPKLQKAGEVLSGITDRTTDAALGAGVGAAGIAAKTAEGVGKGISLFLPPITTPRVLAAVGRRAGAIGDAAFDTSKQLFGGSKAGYSNSLRLMSDAARAVPDLATGAAKGFLLFDVPLAAATSESPTETAHMPLFGAFFGALGQLPRSAGRVVQGQEISARAWGSAKPLSNYGSFSGLDQANRFSVEQAKDPAKAQWLSAIRDFMKPSGAQLYWVSDPVMFKEALQRYAPGKEAAWYDEAAQQRAVTLPMIDDAGQSQKVVLLRDAEAAPHEAMHPFQDVLGERAMEKIDQIVGQEYAPIWDSLGQNYVQQFLGSKALAEYAARGETWHDAVIDISTGKTDWRGQIIAEQVEKLANTYLSREISAEIGDAILRNSGPDLLENKSVPGKIARILGKTMVGLGVEPFEGASTEGQGIPLSFEATGRVREALREGVNAIKVEAKRPDVASIEPYASRRPAITPAKTAEGAKPTVTPPAAEPVPSAEAENARALVPEASDKPVTIGWSSPRENLGAVAEAIATGDGVKINYHSAPGEPAGAVTSNRDARRAVIEAYRAMPKAVRALWEKVFFPDRVIKTGNGIQVMGWSPEVFASNAHKLAEALVKAGEETLVPYPMDSVNETFTEQGWRQLYEDAGVFMKNQLAGETGSGRPLVVPAETQAQGFRAPTVRGEAGGSLSQDRADVISALFGIKLPATPRVGKVYPRNLAGQEVSEATAPGRTSAPVQPREAFSGKSAAKLGIEGREIKEVNPFRQELAQKGIEPSFIEAIQRLNLDNIASVETAPEAPQFRANEFTLQAGFQPRTVEDAITQVRDSSPEEFSKLSQSFKPREGRSGGMTGMAYELGTKLKSAEDLDAVRVQRDFHKDAGKAAMQRSDLATAASEFAKAQFYREAGEYATKSGSAATSAATETQPLPLAGAKFQPSSNPKAIKEAAIRGEADGTIFTGRAHYEAFEKMAASQTNKKQVFEDGFVTNDGEFLNREEAFQRAVSLKQVDKKDLTQWSEETWGPGSGIGVKSLEALNFRANAKFQPALKEWFGDSKVVNEKGEPLEVYHGSPKKDFFVFDIPSRGRNSNVLGSWDVSRGAAFFTDSKPEAGHYASQGGAKSGGTRGFYLKMENPLDIRNGLTEAQFNGFVDEGVNPRWLSQYAEYGGKKWPLFDSDEDPGHSFVAAAKRLGYDGVKFTETTADREGEFTTYAIFEPNQAKLSNGNTTFDSNNPDVRFQPAKTEFARGLEEDGVSFAREGQPGFRQVRAYRDGKEIGMIVSTVDGGATGATGPNAKTADIDMVQVYGDNKRQGIGEALYRELFTDLKEDGITHVVGEPIISKAPIKLRDKIAPGKTEVTIGGAPVRIDAALKNITAQLKLKQPEYEKRVSAVTQITPDMQFQPSKNPKAIKAAAVKVDDQIFEGAFHGLARDTAEARLNRSLKPGESQDGFVTNDGEFLTREQAYARATEQKQISADDGEDGPLMRRGYLDAEGLRNAEYLQNKRDKGASFQPNKEPDSRKTGLAFKKFFSDVTKGDFGKSNKSFEPILDVSGWKDDNFINEQLKHTGNFDEHISKSIPTFKETQIRKGQAIVDAYPKGAAVLDIGASEGSLMKTISSLSKGDIKTTSLDPNPDMANFFREKSQVPGADYVEEAFLNGFEDSGKQVPAFNPDNKFDVVHESMAFQFISPDRADQVAEAKRLMEPDGVFLTEEKVRTPEWASNEKKKDTQFKDRYFSKDELAAKDKTVGFQQSKDETKAVGMVDNMATQTDFEQVLKDNFKHVVQYWDSGNFKGYAAGDNAASVNRLVERMGDLKSDFSTTELPREVSSDTSREDFGFDLANRASFQPREKKLKEFKVGPFVDGFSKAWISPSGKPIQLNGRYHDVWLRQNVEEVSKKWRIAKEDITRNPLGDEQGSRIAALRAGAVRVNLEQNGEATFELRKQDLRKQKNAIYDYVDVNAAKIDRIKVTLFNDDVTDIANSAKASVFRLPINERADNIPFVTGEQEPRSAISRSAEQIFGFDPDAQFQPRKGETEGLPGLDVGREPLSSRELSQMTRSDLREHYPEAVVTRAIEDTVPADIIDSPLYKRSGSESAAVDAFAKRLVDFARQYENNPAYKAGAKWYSDFTPKLQKQFGKDAELMAELLAATSPNTNPEVNFGYAFDALKSLRDGRFDKIIPKFEEGLEKIADGSWEKWYNSQKIKDGPANPSPATFLATWIDKFDLKPKQSNGKLYGMHSVPVLQVFARRWMNDNTGPKTRNFVGNLLGKTDEATIDVWADRTMRWAGYEGFQDRWRILPENVQGVSDSDFAFSQKAFRKAAEELGMKPSALQGALWFAEKQRWADNGWGRLDLGDYRKELEKIPLLESGYAARLRAQKGLKKTKSGRQGDFNLDVRPSRE